MYFYYFVAFSTLNSLFNSNYPNYFANQASKKRKLDSQTDDFHNESAAIKMAKNGRSGFIDHEVAFKHLEYLDFPKIRDYVDSCGLVFKIFFYIKLYLDFIKLSS